MATRSRPPKCQFVDKEKESDWNNGEHSWTEQGCVLRVYAKLPPKKQFKSVSFWFCYSCGNVLNDEGEPLYKLGTKEHKKNEELTLAKPSRSYY